MQTAIPSVCLSCSRHCWRAIFYTPTEEQLEQAKSWYAQMMDSAEKGKAYDLALMPAQMLSQVPYFQREDRRALLPSISLKDVLAYRDALKTNTRPEFLIVGNMSEDQAKTLARMYALSSARKATSGAATRTCWLRKTECDF
jgi:secreted Zn-dependent insulinase-like peptidase